MRKIFTILCIVLSYQISFGQVNTEHILTSKNYNEYASSVKVPKSVTPIWSEDFSNGIPSTWINSTVPWEYRGPSTTPNTSVGSRGAYSGANNIKLQLILQPLKMVL